MSETAVPQALIDAAPQIAAISAFLGGFAATLLGAFISNDRSGKLTAIVTVAFTLAACAFVVSAVAATMLFVTLRSSTALQAADLAHAERCLATMNAGFAIGLLTLLGGIGLCGWLRSKWLGLVTSASALVSAVLVLSLIVRTP